MKKVFTLITHDAADTADTEIPEEIELFGTDGGKSLYEILKQAKGKYTVIAEGDLTCELSPEFYTELDGVNADILLFNGGYCLKTSVLKSVQQKLCTDKFTAQAYASLSAKSIIKLDKFKPFEFSPIKAEYSETDEANLYNVLEEFKKAKSRLTKDVYSFTLDLICTKLVSFYTGAMLAIHAGGLSCDTLKQFDEKLKENIVLYLTLDKRFTAADLPKLRKNNFKFGFFTYNKLKKAQK
ncbi:MAG: hypothetical protein K2L42_01255 [Clostridia bacterium]|nr:hypothetical protein [Clostridia bacterium]